MSNEIIVGNWSRYRDLFTGQKQCEPRANREKVRYIQPAALKDFERAYNEYIAKRTPNIPQECRVRTTFRDNTANGLTRAIQAHLQMCGHFAARVNTTGVYDQRRGIYRTTTARRGMADISAVINGRAVQLEIKAGKDRPSAAQIQVRKEVQAAGGVYEFIHDFTEYMELYNRLTAAAI